MNPLNEAACCFGFAAILAVLIGLAAIGAWGALSFIVLFAPLAGVAERAGCD